MAQDPRSTPGTPPRHECFDPRQGLPALFRGLADDMDALYDLAMAIDRFKAQVLTTSAPSSIEDVPWLLRQPGRNAARIN
jgi:hypothetical protein